MNQTSLSTARICGKCKQNLPLEAFYINKKTQCPDRYCKECRKQNNRSVQKGYARLRFVNEPKYHLVITRINDREVRLKLILHALHLVNESIARKQRKVREADFLLE